MKPHLNLVFIGHVDHGKSTLIGRLLVEMGVVKEKDLLDEAGSFKFAWVMDREKEERARGVTIDIAYQKIETQKNIITIIDAPGHRDFVKNMITGASQADAAVLVVAADDGIMPQTREHAALAFTLGVGQIIVAINKMDLVGFRKEVYEEIKNSMITLLSSIGYRNASELPFIPVAAFYGEGITKPSEKMPWYKGPTLLGALEQLKEPEKPIKKPLRIPIQDVFSITGVGTVPIGRVETGILRVKDIVIFEPSGSSGEVRSIEMHHEQIQQAVPGDNIGFSVRGVSKDEVRRGDVAGHLTNPPTVTNEFIGKVVILAVPTEISPGFTPLFHCHSAHVPGTIVEILQKIDPKTGSVVEENPRSLRKGDAGLIKVKLAKPMVIERASDIPELSRFAIRHSGQTIAAGMCVDLVELKKGTR
ncbi:MAG: translation elongation factor EF-1 subunit alpha [Candidatus Hadarchaeum sp.]|uniref:translation elongation factor EF-1 subunit alpha n=1 Tax=Candidatus Hadarchaeum sp. TaxID=2883567 RepID=UPI003D0E5BB2